MTLSSVFRSIDFASESKARRKRIHMTKKNQKEQIWSIQQNVIFDFVANGTGHGVVRARAGTGKTTTILESLRHAPAGRNLLCAFNKKIAEELTAKLVASGANGEAKTLHSLGYAMVMAAWGRVRPDTDRGFRLAEQIVSQRDGDASNAVVRVLAKLVSFAKGSAPFATHDDLFDLILAIDTEEANDEGWSDDDLAAGALSIMKIAKEKDAIIDFDDMVWLPVVNGWAKGTYDLVIVDEAQDMNATQILLAQAACRKGGRIIVVGDDRQAIYGFRGADSGSIDRLKRELSATEMGLTVTYRCPRIVVEYAARLVPDYTAAPGAPKGSITSQQEDVAMAGVKIGDCVLSRKNAPLARMCLAVLRSGRKARIEGRDVGAGLVALVKKLSNKGRRSVPETMEALTNWAEATAEAFKRTNRPSAEERINFVYDQADTIREMAEGQSSISSMLTRIEGLFAVSDAPCVVFSSIHKAKGLEWNRVFILRDTLYPKKASDNVEEQNLEYVAVTRTKRDLVWIEKKAAA